MLFTINYVAVAMAFLTESETYTGEYGENHGYGKTAAGVTCNA